MVPGKEITVVLLVVLQWYQFPPLYTLFFGDWNVRLAGQDVVVLVLTVAQLIGLLVVMAMVT